MRIPYNKLVLFICLALIGNSSFLHATTNDSIPKPLKRPQFLNINTTGGVILPTNDYIMEGTKFPAFTSFAVKYGIGSAGDQWEDIAYGMPYYGIGIYTAKFFKKEALGTPVSIFLFQGSEIKRFNPRLALRYELNLGLAFNWNPYDPFDNPDQIALGSSVNAHIGANIHLKAKLSDHWDLLVGAGLTHFSNGAYQLPNYGLNMVGGFAELSYTFNPPNLEKIKKEFITPPKFKRRYDWDILFVNSSRQIRVDTVGTGMPSPIYNHNFKVFGLSGAFLIVQNYKYKWGPSLDITYDETGGVSIWREEHPDDGKLYDRMKLGAFHERLQVGLSMKGEVVFPYISLFANMGYTVYAGYPTQRWYQVMGVKAYLKDNLFGTFGIRANRFSKAQYLFWSIGVTIGRERESRRLKDVFK